jgi:hypothetical protein
MENLVTQRDLIVKLNDDEVRTYSEELARVTTLQAEAEDEKKAVTSGFKDKIDRFIADSRTLARKISTRQELRAVDCEWVNDYDNIIAVLHRKDTGEVIDRQKLTEEEMQLSLPGKKGKVAR